MLDKYDIMDLSQKSGSLFIHRQKPVFLQAATSVTRLVKQEGGPLFWENRMDEKVRRELQLVFTIAMRIQIMFRQQGKCLYCGIEEWRLRKRLHAHRVIPGKCGGKYNTDNVILLCPKCHREADYKRNKNG